MEVNSNDAIRAAVEQNAGIAFLSATTVANDLEQGRLVRVGVKGVKPVRQLFMVTHPGATASRAVHEFIQFVVASQGE
jgi:DNA-binding transcriptional LysR family regulator